MTTTEWYATCKDCGKEFGYSDSSYRHDVQRGLSRPERCAEHRRQHSNEIASLGLSHFNLTPIKPIPPAGLSGGSLGKLIRAERIHKPREIKSSFEFDRFGINDSHIREYFEIMQNHQITVVVAPTGAGKSTFLPYRLMVPPSPFPKDLWTRNGQIVITQPRIQATRNIPAFIARDLHGSSLGAGYDIGFRHSGSPATDRNNKLVFLTDGTLINMIVKNEIGRLSVIMIDEAHERSLNIDLILGLLKKELPKYPHLKLIIASATIDTRKFLTYYGAPEAVNPDSDDFKYKDKDQNELYRNSEIEKLLSSPNVNSPVGFYGFPGKRKHPVSARFRLSDPIPDNAFAGRMPDELAKKVLEILVAMETGDNPDLTTMEIKEEYDDQDGNPKEKDKVIDVKGDILGFLHGEKPILEAVEKIQAGIEEDNRLRGKADVLPLYTKLPQRQQDLALKPKKNKNRYRVVISTNVAETSLTVEGIVHVVDSGLINEAQWDPETRTSFVLPKPHSRAGCRQRWGRAGRVQPGIAHCLYTENQFENFIPYTDPEIVRAPIDQIVLTALSAGVNKFDEFEWIEPPPPEELTRAPDYLKSIGALDEDGDITNHGLELRFFPAEIDIANLMILADRFGCVVEMATLLPMLDLGGYTKLLQWDRGWDAPTKRAVNQIHQGLIQPCQDDVEFYLKIWELWEGSSFGRKTERERKAWAEHFFVNHEILKKNITKEREALISSLSGHKKDKKNRPINFRLLNRLRIVMTYGLSSHIYQLVNKDEVEQNNLAEPIYKPFFADSNLHPEMYNLHKDAQVKIDPTSVCFGRTIPEYFLCGKRRRNRVRKSPLSEPENIISASFITLINPDWFDIIDGTSFSVARLIAAESKNPHAASNYKNLVNRIFVDQFFPIKATYLCRQETIGHDLLLEEQVPISSPLQFHATRSNEDIEALDLVEELEKEGELSVSKKSDFVDGIMVVTDPEQDEEAEEIPIWAYLLDDDDELGSNKRRKTRSLLSTTLEPRGHVWSLNNQNKSKEPFEALVIGYEFDQEKPRLIFDIPIKPDPFDTFCEIKKVGQNIDVKILKVEKYINDWLTYAILKEVDTGLEIVMDPYDASLSARSYAVEMLNNHIGTTIPVIVEMIQQENRQVRVSRLKFSEHQSSLFMGKETEKIVDATIMDVQNNGINVWLDPDFKELMPIGAFVHINGLPNRPKEISVSQRCKVKIKAFDGERPYYRKIDQIPEDVISKIQNENIGNNLIWSEESSSLGVKGKIGYEQRRKLLDLHHHPDYQRVINILYRRSNGFRADVLDIWGIEILEKQLESQNSVPVRVVRIEKNGAEVETEFGVREWIPRKRITRDENDSLEDILTIEEELPMYVSRINKEKGYIVSNLFKPEDNPYLQFKVGESVTGTVADFYKDGEAVFVTLMADLDGFLRLRDISPEKIENATDVLTVGDPVFVKITGIDVENERLQLTMWAFYEQAFQIDTTDIGKLKGRHGTSIKSIESNSKTIINIQDDGFGTISGDSEISINDAIQAIELKLRKSIILPPESAETELVPSEKSYEFLDSIFRPSESFSAPNKAEKFSRNLSFSSSQQELLTKPSGSELDFFFNSQQSALERIENQTGVKIEIDTVKSNISIVSYSPVALQIAEDHIRSLLIRM
jgi:HrpA-like RNA helicase/ribosomal protein S1